MTWQGGRSLARNNKPLHGAILNRDPVCKLKTYCNGAPSVEVDHKMEWSDGGTNDPANLQGVCRACHKVKTRTHAAAKRAQRQAQRFHPPEPHPGMSQPRQ